MPAEVIRRRGGAVRVRTKRLKNGKYIRIYVVRKAGPRGGRTVAGETKRRRFENDAPK